MGCRIGGGGFDRRLGLGRRWSQFGRNFQGPWWTMTVGVGEGRMVGAGGEVGVIWMVVGRDDVVIISAKSEWGWLREQRDVTEMLVWGLSEGVGLLSR